MFGAGFQTMLFEHVVQYPGKIYSMTSPKTPDNMSGGGLCTF